MPKPTQVLHGIVQEIQLSNLRQFRLSLKPKWQQLDVLFESVFVLRWSYASELVLHLERVTCVCWLVSFVYQVFGRFFKTFAT